MSDTNQPAWAVERAREILALINVEPSEWCPDCDGQGEIDDGKCGRCGKYGCRTKTCPACNGDKMKPIDRVGIIASALTVPDGHVRLPSGDVVKVLGTLPMTADRCVVVWGSPVFFDDGQGVRLASVSLVGDQTGHGGEYVGAAFPARKTHMSCPDQCPIDKCYSTRAAAESARAGGRA